MPFRVEHSPDVDSPFVLDDARAETPRPKVSELEGPFEFEGPFELGEVARPSPPRSAPEYVRWIQSALNRALGTQLIVDGQGGPATRSAIVQFQRAYKLNPDGIVGPNTETALASASAVPAPALIGAGQPDIVRGGMVVTGGTCPTEFANEGTEERLPSPAPRPSGSLADGRVVVAEHPMLRKHKGTSPDLILRWNSIQGPGAIDVVVHFHGFSDKKSGMQIDKEKEPHSGLDFVDPSNPFVVPLSTKPTLGILPRGHFYGGKSGTGYDFRELVKMGALDQLVVDSLARVARLVGHHLELGRLILTGHSGGGAPIAKILADTKTDPDEVHIFDGTYSTGESIVRWARQRITRELATPATRTPALRILYKPGSGTASHAEAIAQKICEFLKPAAAARLRPFFRVDGTSVDHLNIPNFFGWRLLANPAADLPRAKTRACPDAEIAQETPLPLQFREVTQQETIPMSDRQFFAADEAYDAYQERALREESDREHLAWLDVEADDTSTEWLDFEGPFELGEVARPSPPRSAPEYVRWIQSALNRALGTQLIVDGQGGPATRSAIVQFQRAYKLNPDGIVGPNTETALASASAVPAPALIGAGQPDIVRSGMVVTGGTCPTEFAEVIRGWGQHEEKVERLAQAEQDKINKLADLIVATFTTPGCVPLGQIVVMGHADQDVKGASFEKKVSNERAQSVAIALSAAIIKAFKARKTNRLAKGAIAFLPSPIGVGATQPDAANVPRVTDRTLNRRVTIQLQQRGAPVPPPDTFDARIERFLKLLATNKVVPDPKGKRTERAKCILGKIRRPGILDVFVDGTAANQTVGPHKVAENLCSFRGQYDPPPISNADFAKFLGTVSNVLKGPGFAPTVPDDKILSGLSELMFMINEGIIRVERYITLMSSDFGYVGDRTRGTRLSSIFADHLNDENSIYFCYKDFHGNE